MIEIAISSALLTYLGCLLSFLFFLWFLSHLKSRNKKILSPIHMLSTCEYCHFAYLASSDFSISRCPQCLSYNERSPSKK